MSRLGKATKQVSRMLRNKIPYDAVEVRKIAKMVESHSGEKMSSMFPPGSLKKPTEAKPEIWQDWAAFEARRAEGAGGL